MCEKCKALSWPWWLLAPNPGCQIPWSCLFLLHKAIFIESKTHSRAETILTQAGFGTQSGISNEILSGGDDLTDRVLSWGFWLCEPKGRTPGSQCRVSWQVVPAKTQSCAFWIRPAPFGCFLHWLYSPLRRLPSRAVLWIFAQILYAKHQMRDRKAYGGMSAYMILNYCYR